MITDETRLPLLAKGYRHWRWLRRGIRDQNAGLNLTRGDNSNYKENTQGKDACKNAHEVSRVNRTLVPDKPAPVNDLVRF